MGRQINTKKVLEDKGVVKNYIVFRELKAERLEWFLEIYKQDRYKARVLFKNNNLSLFIERDVCFERVDGSFEICRFRRTFGMSKTNIIYSREKKLSSLIYKNKKFYFKNGNSIKHAMYVDILNHFGFAKGYLIKKFPWLRNIDENKYCYNVSLSSIVTHKLFNAEKVLKHIYNTPINVIKILTEQYEKQSKGYGYITKYDWKRMQPFLTNVENLSLGLFLNHLFRDTVEMAIKLDKKVNCSWSEKRLKHEHDTWAKDLRKIMIEFEPVIQLNPFKIYEDFEKFTGYRLLRTNVELIEEGHRQDHCVAGYGNSVSSGNCGIFQVNGYTLEVNYRTDYLIGTNSNNRKKLFYGQLRGLRNSSAPLELNNTVNMFITEFNKSYDFEKYEEYLKNKKQNLSHVWHEIEVNELPF